MRNQDVNELIDRLAAECLDPADWRRLQAGADERPELWRTLAVAQYERDRFNRGLNEAADRAEQIELPLGDFESPLHPETPRATRRLNQWNQWAGWALAAVLLLAFAVRFTSVSDLPAGPSAAISEASLPGEVLDRYIEAGRQNGSVMGEIPEKVLIRTRPVSDGDGYEVYYLRQILERTVVPDLYQYAGQNEQGQPQLIRYERPIRRGT